MDNKINHSEIIDVLVKLKSDMENLRYDDHEFTHGLLEIAVPLDDVLDAIDSAAKSIDSSYIPKRKEVWLR